MITSVLISSVLPFQSSGTFIAVSRYASATMIPPSVLGRGIGWQVTDLIFVNQKHHFVTSFHGHNLVSLFEILQGIGTLLGAFFGTANGTAVSV